MAVKAAGTLLARALCERVAQQTESDRTVDVQRDQSLNHCQMVWP